MRISRAGWALAAIVAIAVALFAFRQMHGGYILTRKPHAVTLRWNPAEGATSYNIYRRDGRSSGYKQVGTSVEPRFIDSPVPSGAVLVYAVTAVQDQYESPFSAEMRVDIP
jgi:fibronectin type 3 domain-containing protein